MKIKMETLTEGMKVLDWQGDSREYPELLEVGCIGPVDVSISVLPAGDSFLLEGTASGSLNYECAGCGGPRKGPFSIKIKLLVENSSKEGVHWLEEEVEEFDNYVVAVGSREPEFSIISIIREQILLNCNLSTPEEGVVLEKCPDCGTPKIDSNLTEEEFTTDPRWDKLKSLLSDKEDDNTAK
jgi:uncharacterized metal-binding protein YceD (DUF177 family)